MLGKSIIIINLILLVAQTTYGCGCFGQGTCDVNGNRVAFCSQEGRCDCCPPCNTCSQLLAGCLASQFISDVTLEPSTPTNYVLNQAISPSTIQSEFGPATSFIEVCVDPALPDGLNISQQDDFTFALTGTPTVTFPVTTFRIIVKGSASYLGETTVQFGVVACEPEDPESCNVGDQRCIDSTWFETCVYKPDGTGEWQWGQGCAPGSVCRTVGNNIICGLP